MHIRHAAVLPILFASTLLAQTANLPQGLPTARSLESVAYPLTIENGKLAGAGAAVLTKAIAQADFVAIGEDHITHEIPQFAAAVCDAMGATGGISAMTFESSPAAAKFVQDSLKMKRSARLQKMAELEKRYPDSVAFLNIQEENDLAAHCATVAQRKDFQIWGLDQEFLGSAGWILERMLATNPGPKSRAAILKLQAMERVDVAVAQKTGDTSTFLLLAAPNAELDAALAQAAAAIKEDGTPATQALFHDLTESREIYLENETHRGSESNTQRARLLKQNFVADYSAAEAKGQRQRILLKFGDWHLYKGINPIRQRDLGNFIAELADGQNKTSLHIMVLGAKGTHALPNGYQRPLKLEPFVMDEDKDYGWMKPIFDAQKKGTWMLYDLRPQRYKSFHLNPDWERVVYGYDLLVVIPELTPATMIQ